MSQSHNPVTSFSSFGRTQHSTGTNDQSAVTSFSSFGRPQHSTGTNQQHISLFFRLPPELRLEIYHDVLGGTRTRPLYIQRHIWSWTQSWTQGRLGQIRSRKCHALLIICRRMRNEALEILYKRHELQFYTAPSASLLAQDNTRKQICNIEEYEEVLKWVHRLRIVLFVPQEPRDERILLALMAYVKAVLAEREVPLESFTLEMCAFGGRSCKPSAVLYAAQGFRFIENVKFEFQSGFSGVGNESAKELLVQQTAQKTEENSTEVDMSKDKALYGLEQAWSKAQPAWYNPMLISNCWLGTTLEV